MADQASAQARADAKHDSGKADDAAAKPNRLALHSSDELCLTSLTVVSSSLESVSISDGPNCLAVNDAASEDAGYSSDELPVTVVSSLASCSISESVASCSISDGRASVSVSDGRADVGAAASPARSERDAPSAESHTPAAAGARLFAAEASAPPSPALEVLTRPDARVFTPLKATLETSAGLGFQGSVTCNFKARVITFTPEPKRPEVAKVKIDLRCGVCRQVTREQRRMGVKLTLSMPASRNSTVQTFALMPELRKLTLKLKAAAAAAVSPAAGVAPAALGAQLTLTWRSDKFLEVAEEVQKTLQFRPGTFESDFVLVVTKELGKGGNASVYRVRRRDAPPDAIHYADKQPLRDNDFTNEAKLLHECKSCDYITRMVAFYPACEGSPQHLVMELMEGGDLLIDVLLKRKTLLGADTPWMSEEEVMVVVWRVLRALQFMHTMSQDGVSILHRDVKPDNILLARRGADGCGVCATAKLADLGHAKALDGVSRTWSTDIGTPAYTPPEIAAAMSAHGRLPVNVGHTKKLDMWSVGVLLYVCFVQRYPYGSARPSDVMEMAELNLRILTEGLQGMMPEALARLVPPGSPQAALLQQRSAHGRALMQALLQRQPADRLSADDALQHPWFDGYATGEGAGITTP